MGWGGLLVARVALIGVAAAIGAKVAASPSSIPLMLAVTLGAQMLVVRQRVRASGVFDYAVPESVEAFSSEVTIIPG